MPKRVPERELDAIVAVVAAHPEGVQARAINEGLPNALPPRMLQRRLALLVGQKRLVAEGRGKGRRYRAPATITGIANIKLDNAVLEARGEVAVYVPVSPEGLEIKKAVRAPIQDRRPVGYQRDFLDDYQPNVTCRRKRASACSRWVARRTASARREPTPARSTAAC
jgi:hypothetical protein